MQVQNFMRQSCKGENGITRYEFEPDEDMLNAIMVKYPRSVIK